MELDIQDAQLVRRTINGILSEFDFKTKSLNPRYLKDLKQILKTNDAIVKDFVKNLFEEFYKNDCDRRLGATLIADYFFNRSHKFRLEFINNLQNFFVFTLETDPIRYPLPPPISAAKELKKDTLRIVKSWIEKFGLGYVKLKGAEEFLKRSKNFDFAGVNAELAVERQRVLDEEFRQRVKAKKIGDKIREILAENKIDIERTIVECKNSINLLYPNEFETDPDQPSTSQANSNGKNDCSSIANGANGTLSTSELTSSSNLRELDKLHGYKGKTGFNLVINTGKIELIETEDNKDLINALKDAKLLLTKTEGTLQKWLQKLSAYPSNENEPLVKELISLKSQIQRELGRCDQLNIKKSLKIAGSDSESDYDDDFIDVEDTEMMEFKEGDNEEVPEDVLEKDKDKEDKPGTSGFLNKEIKKEKDAIPKNGAKEKQKIPTLPFGLDLKYWGQTIEPAAMDRGVQDHKFWRADDPGDELVTESAEIYNTRLMTFVGERPKIKHSCRFPMENGKLCSRMDIEKCPFHGKIIPRDEQGFPIEELDQGALVTMKQLEERLKEKKEKDEKEYLADVEAQVGLNLTVEKKKKGWKANRNYGTARPRGKPENARKRLEAKIFNKNAMRRVADTLASIQKRKAEKNFSNQFAYAVTNKR